ncbi:MAG: hypothetical protein ACO1SV_02540 [Fimbriimonas sp.]
MKDQRRFWAICVAAGMVAAGCEEPVPTNPKPANGANPYVSGSPEERIKSIEANPELTAEEKARRIAVIKSRNNLK